MIKVIDDILLASVEKVSQTIEVWTGINNFTLSRYLVFCSVCLKTAEIVFEKIKPGIKLEEGLSWTFSLAAHCFFMLLWILSIHNAESKCTRNSENVFSNPLKVDPVFIFLRVFNVSLDSLELLNAALNSKMDLGTIRRVTITFVIILMSCDPLPPGSKSKLKQSIQAFLSSFKLSRAS